MRFGALLRKMIFRRLAGSRRRYDWMRRPPRHAGVFSIAAVQTAASAAPCRANGSLGSMRRPNIAGAISQGRLKGR